MKQRLNLEVGPLEHAFKSKVSIDRGRGRGFRGRKEEAKEIIRHRIDHL